MFELGIIIFGHNGLSEISKAFSLNFEVMDTYIAFL